MSGIFISYRRSDSPDATGRIYDRLVAEFGRAQVFKDVDSIPLGRDFRGHLNDIVGECGVMLAIIGPHWTNARNQAGQRRLDDPDDFVRIELETALARDIPVVPVLVGHAPLPVASELPGSLASLVFRQSIEVRPDPDFHNDATRLVTALRAMLDPTAAAAAIAQSVAATGRQSGRRLGWIVAALPRVAPDGRRVVVVRETVQRANIWLLDGARMSRVTFGENLDWFPVWSPDGTRIVFASSRSGGLLNIYQKLLDGAVGDAQRLVASGPGQASVPDSWSPDGRFLLYTRSDPQTGADLWVVPMVGAHTPSVFLKTPFDETDGVFSPDGRWVAYQSNESGRYEIYVRPFHPPGAQDSDAASGAMQWQVSTAGGIWPTWRPDGKEIDYIDPSGAMMAAPITVSGAKLAAGTPVKLFQTRIFDGGGVTSATAGREYDVARDGRFLIDTVQESAAAPITLILNWNPEAAPQ